MAKINTLIIKEGILMAVADKLIMFKLAVKDMPAAKTFYADNLGLKVVTDYKQDEGRWWVSLALPQGGVTITLSTYLENMKPGTISVYLGTSDIFASQRELISKGMKVNEVKDDLYGPGSGVKWFNLNDPEGNQIFLVQS